ncbi:U3 small nucleolar RNA-associated protein 18 homolog [Pangasianodon hypophthalmus]|uniref:U3 small nucleolar RNA-associated protein 18 homolog n=1 Tax=Pangasianodon hypophthalmus TaxID=310915 RepID=UPI0023081A72|nr:U3 small nucleolar RNA-associated protein 18 homolog [Pangasianodon hypophthalmus]
MEEKKARSKVKRPLLEEGGAPAEAAREEQKRRKHTEELKALGEEDESVKLLEELVFGAEEELLERLVQHGDDEKEDEDTSDSETENEARLRLPSQRKAVWEDEDDEVEEDVDMTHRFRKDFTRSDAEASMSKQRLQQRLKEQFQKAMGGVPSWAETTVKKSKRKGEDDEDEEDDDDDELLKRTGNYVAASETLPKGIIKIKKCLNANNANPGEGRLTSVQFHTSAQVVLTAGLDHTISLFQVDGKTNPKIQSIHLENFPVNKACFSADGEQVVATGMRNKLFYIYDMMEGKIIPVPRVRGLNEQRVKEFEVSPDGQFLLLTGSSGFLHLMTMKTKEVVRSVKINGSVCAAAFNSDGSKIFTNSEEGEVFIWDVRSSKCVNRFADDGCVTATSLAVSKDDRYVACGSQSGVVNIYSQKECVNSSSPKPLKCVMNLLTAATSLRFNPTSEILAIGSRAEDEANRLVHIPSFSVFSNFPLFRKKTIYRPHCIDFSPHSGFYSIANDKGQALLFRLLHYKDF